MVSLKQMMTSIGQFKLPWIESNNDHCIKFWLERLCCNWLHSDLYAGDVRHSRDKERDSERSKKVSSKAQSRGQQSDEAPAAEGHHTSKGSGKATPETAASGGESKAQMMSSAFTRFRQKLTQVGT